MAQQDSNPNRDDVESLYRSWRVPLRVYFQKRAPNRARVDDLVQLVFEGLLKYGIPDQIRSAQDYLFKIAQNVLSDEFARIEKERSFGANLPPEALDHHLNVTPSLWVDDSTEAVDQDHLRKVLSQMKPEHRLVLELLSGGLRYEEISEKTGFTIHAVRKYIAQARAIVHKSYDANALEESINQQPRKAP